MEPTTTRQCKICKKTIKGRSDKLFCSIKCKNQYHIRLRNASDIAVENINRILHRNRSILLEIMGKNNEKRMVNRKVLESKKFTFKYHTHFHINSQGKIYYYVYDFSWMEFSDDQIMINRVQTLT